MLTQRQIAKLREKMELTQAEMARLLGVARPLTISHWERGHSTPTGAIMRFLCYLESLSDEELCKAIQRLDKLSKNSIS